VQLGRAPWRIQCSNGKDINEDFVTRETCVIAKTAGTSMPEAPQSNHAAPSWLAMERHEADQ
jgi:hypothetical protein